MFRINLIKKLKSIYKITIKRTQFLITQKKMTLSYSVHVTGWSSMRRYPVPHCLSIQAAITEIRLLKQSIKTALWFLPVCS